MSVHTRRTIRLVTDSYPDPPAFDTAISHATLARVSEGTEPETLRLHRPARVVAFGPKDRLAEGFGDAVRAAHEQGFASILRLAGGRAAVFHERTLAFSWAIPLPSPREGIRSRFELLAALIAEAFRSLGVDARVGAVPGEYCPGEFSVNARGATKLMGVGQRIVRHAAHVGGVVVVGDGARVRDVLIPVYRALCLEWDPSTSGSLEDEVSGVRWEDARRAIVERFADRFELVDGRLGPETLERAGVFEPDHLATA
jgi:octanoyl-[GcvH]:protein N-octanoyltransferase